MSMVNNFINSKDKHYKSKEKSIENVLRNSGMKVSKAAPAGSRARQQQHKSSDQDMIFSIKGDPPQDKVYLKVKKVMKANFPEYNVYLGKNENVIHLKNKLGAKFDLKLLPETEFDRQNKKNRDYRRNIL